MNTTLNFSVSPTPNAFGPKRKGFLDLILRGGKKIISQQFIQSEPQLKHEFNKGLIEIIFSVKINNADLTTLNLKKCLNNIFNLTADGVERSDAVKKSIMQNLYWRHKH